MSPLPGQKYLLKSKNGIQVTGRLAEGSSNGSGSLAEKLTMKRNYMLKGNRPMENTVFSFLLVHASILCYHSMLVYLFRSIVEYLLCAKK